MEGKVKFFDEKKGFGFIESESGDYFFHYSEIISDKDYKTIENGARVEFDVKDLGRGDTAFNVKKKELR
ncbi:cold-shock DNA-binding domain protein [Anaerococcus hydrogenalis DSM 7454]|uniref:Cold-shock DNA-binding domain protein n=1 Tax=Anaerococcus hydrogenalis DSM 7454 TaxID=561177 RepID=B6WAT4_9FIRM|nr:cold shock domain-containing protein [Anaerococcus hydrogenalis]EEB35434.1 cold-shock DNA-binding domain protein [Anaerococcus hydrogenalis DSM 7454]